MWRNFVRDNFQVVRERLGGAYNLGNIIRELSRMYKERQQVVSVPNVPINYLSFVAKNMPIDRNIKKVSSKYNNIANFKNKILNTRFDYNMYFRDIAAYHTKQNMNDYRNLEYLDFDKIKINRYEDSEESRDMFISRVFDPTWGRIYIRLSWTTDNGINRSKAKIFDTTRQNFMRDYKEWIRWDSDRDFFQVYENTKQKVIRVNNSNRVQLESEVLRDGEQNCLFKHIMNAIYQQEKKIKKERGINKYVELEVKAKELRELYEGGVPKDKLNEVFEALNISVSIIDIDGVSYYKYVPTKRFTLRLRYIHTKYGHVDRLSSNAQVIVKNDLRDVYQELKKQGKFLIYSQNRSDEINKIWTEDYEYTLEGSEFMDYMKKLKRTIIPIHKNNKCLYDYVSAAYHVNGVINFSSDKVGQMVKNYDHRNSFAQYKSCKYYMKFPKTITDIYKLEEPFLYEGNELTMGIYEINIIEAPNNILSKLKCYEGKIILPAPELKFLYDYGFLFEIISCAIGPEFEFEFGDGWDKKDSLGNRFYCRASGILASSRNNKTSIIYDCESKEEAEILGAYLDRRNVKNLYTTSYGNKVVLEKRSEKFTHSRHIAAFLTCYSRISTLIQLVKLSNMNGINLHRIVSDGIYYDGEITDIDPYYRIEEKILPKSSEGKDGYLSKYKIKEYTNYELVKDLPSKWQRLCLYNGLGGSGKTYSAQKRYPEATYSTVSWILSNEKRIDNAQNTVYCKLIGECFGNQIQKHKFKSGTLIIDEITMLNYEELKKVLDTVPPYIKIIFIGDYNKETWEPYQLRPITKYDGDETIIDLEPQLYEFTSNYRCKCKKLSNILDKVRNGEANNLGLKTINISELKDKANDNDFILCAKKQCSNRKCLKYEDCECKEKNGLNLYNSLEYSNKTYKYVFTGQILYEGKKYYNGQYIFSYKKIDNKNMQLRQASTVHSMQGLTLPEESNIYIDLDGMFDKNHLYVALSRAQYFKQIYVITKK